MGDGIRPKRAFSYAALRYKEIIPDCFDDKKKCPEKSLCKSCVHADCKEKRRS